MTHSARRVDALAAEIRDLLRTRQLGRALRSFDRVASTNTVAAEWAAAGAPHGAMVLAEYQTAGRGRLGRSWQSQAGLNLTLSLVLRLAVRPDRLPLVTIAGCVAVAESVESTAAPLRVSVKWPNDILLNGRKCCGMLLETATSSGSAAEPQPVILGVGINVNQDSFPLELSESATSILLETGRMTSRSHLVADACLRLERRLEQAIVGSKMLRRDFMSRMVDLGVPVRLQYSRKSGHVVGVTLGLDETGGLILDTDGGRRVFHAGEVTRSG